MGDRKRGSLPNYATVNGKVSSRQSPVACPVPAGAALCPSPHTLPDFSKYPCQVRSFPLHLSCWQMTPGTLSWSLF